MVYFQCLSESIVGLTFNSLRNKNMILHENIPSVKYFDVLYDSLARQMPSDRLAVKMAGPYKHTCCAIYIDPPDYAGFCLKHAELALY